MEIKNVETILLSCPVPKEHQLDWDAGTTLRELKVDMTIIKITTDEGITGIGEASNYVDPKMVKMQIENFKSELIGKDPFEVEKLTESLHLRWTESGFLRSTSIAAINQALWDIVGKKTKQPVSKLLGGRYADRVKAYASAGQMSRTAKEIYKEALNFYDMSLTAYKLRVTFDDAVDKVEAAREAFGTDSEIMVECNMLLPNAKTAIKMIKKIEKYEPTWVECPLVYTDIEGYIEIRSKVDVPIAAGENLDNFLKFKEWVDRDAMDVIQPDCNLAGFNEARKAAIYASYRGMPCCPHNWHNAITRAANAQLIASVPNHFMLEMNITWNHSCPAFKEEIVDEPIKVKNGYIDIPNRPGLGVELNEDAVKKYPYIEGPKSAPI